MEPVEIVDLEHAARTTAAEIVAVQQSGYAVESELIGFKELPPLLESAADIALLDVVMLGARTEGRLIGVVGYHRCGAIVDVDRLVVDPAHFRHGVGTALLAELHHREATARRFQVSTGAANTPAIRFYQSLGYRIERSEALRFGLEIVHLART